MTTGTQGATYSGFWRTLFGSLADGTSNVCGGATIDQLLWSDTQKVFFVVVGNIPNSGWTQFTVGGRVFKRADAAYQYSAPNTSWVWSGQATSPFTGNPTITWEA